MTDVILVIPFGAHDTPIGHGAVDYQPGAYRADITKSDSPWVVPVPPHVAKYLAHNAGFYPMPEESVPSFTGTADLYHPDGPRSCSVDGRSYEPDAIGVNRGVPSQHVGVLIESFGFRPAAEVPTAVLDEDALALFLSDVVSTAMDTPPVIEKPARGKSKA